MQRDLSSNVFVVPKYKSRKEYIFSPIHNIPVVGNEIIDNILRGGASSINIGRCYQFLFVRQHKEVYSRASFSTAHSHTNCLIDHCDIQATRNFSFFFFSDDSLIVDRAPTESPSARQQRSCKSQTAWVETVTWPTRMFYIFFRVS